MQVTYYEAVFRDEDLGESPCAWEVVKWYYENPVTGTKSNRLVLRYPGTETGGADAMAVADKLNRMKESEHA